MSRLTIWLIRHGETEANAGVWLSNPNSSCLTPLGRAQAKEIATKIEFPPDLIITSPLIRAQETAKWTLKKWPKTPCQTWPIQELVYLSPQHMQALSPEERKKAIKAYWLLRDPYFSDGDDAESFASFLKRIADFHKELMKQQGFILIFGHGQFFKAYTLGLDKGFEPTFEWKAFFRQQEIEHKIQNAAILKLEFP